MDLVGVRAGLAVLVIVAGAGCAGGSADPTGAGTPPVEGALREAFPEHAARILEPDEPFAAHGSAFALKEDALGRRGIDVTLPERGDGAIRVRAARGGFAITVREMGAAGDGRLAGGAVAYPRAGGTSLWTAVPAGFEEWLLLEPGLARAGVVVASWEVAGGTLREANGAIGIFDEGGVARFWVTAPAAYAAGGREVQPTLAARADRIELTVDAAGAAVLIDPAWTTVAPMGSKRGSHTATLLTDGKVLVAGGTSSTSSPQALPSAEIFDPTINVWSTAAPMGTARSGHTATRLADGKVLVAGGFQPMGPQTIYLASAELYDPAADLWTPVGSLSTGRSNHRAVLLASGKVLIMGGADSQSFFASAELYDPATAAWTPAGPMSVARTVFAAALLASGKVIVTGGYASPTFATTELYDPATNAWTPGAPMITGRYGHTATLLADDTVLVAGGHYFDSNGSLYAAPELYDAAGDAWTQLAPMGTPRYIHTAARLASGKVLLAGGYGGAALASAELYDPAAASFSAAGSMSTTRYAHSETLLPSGLVLVAGGAGPQGPPLTNTMLASAELFGPVQGDPCTSQGECTSGTCVDGFCCDQACDAGPCDACSVAAGADVNGVCKLLTGPACNDGDACSQTDTCQAGVCTGSGFVVCPQPAICHAQGACDPATGTCSSPAQSDGAACDDSSACSQLDTCQAGTPTHADAPAGTPCSAGQCNGAGQCVGCNGPADCSGVDDDCKTKTCVAEVCGFDYAPSGTIVSVGQQPGNCQTLECDGAGGIASVPNDNDQPDDGDPCTQDVCNGGVPSNPLEPAGTPCGGGDLCTANGACVECLSDAQCSGVETCGGGGTPNQCGCTPVSKNQTCQGKCGSVTGNCGQVEACGGCPGQQTCFMSACCSPQSQGTTCAGKCGNVINNCGQTVSCGNTCVAPQTCGGGGTQNVCGCTDDGASCAGKDCGTTTNNCGQMVTCAPNMCVAPQTCGGGGTPNVCG